MTDIPNDRGVPGPDHQLLLHALDIYVRGRLEEIDGRWLVADLSNGSVAHVDHGDQSCDCADYLAARVPCRHVWAVRLQVGATDGSQAKPLLGLVAYLLHQLPTATGSAPAALARLEAEQQRLFGELARVAEMVGRQVEQAAEEYVSIKRAAEITTLSPMTLYRAVNRRDLPAANKSTDSHSLWRIKKTDLYKWMEPKEDGRSRRSPLQELIDKHLKRRSDNGRPPDA